MADQKFVFHSMNKIKKKEEPPKTAVALAYDPETDTSPRILAAGKGELAERIVSRAKEEQIPVHQDAALAKTLSKLEIGENIPPELYEVVAEVLLFVDRMDKIKEKVADSKPFGRK